MHPEIFASKYKRFIPDEDTPIVGKSTEDLEANLTNTALPVVYMNTKSVRTTNWAIFLAVVVILIIIALSWGAIFEGEQILQRLNVTDGSEFPLPHQF